jgi:hypothetical protein
MKRFVLRLLLFSLPFLVLGVIQYLVDPLDLYSGIQANPPVDQNPRLDKVGLCQAFSPLDTDALILGSSRSMRLPTGVFERYGYRAFNWGVNGGLVEDFYCITRYMVEELGCRLRLIVIGWEPLMCSEAYPLSSDLANLNELARYLSPMMMELRASTLDLAVLVDQLRLLPAALDPERIPPDVGEYSPRGDLAIQTTRKLRPGNDYAGYTQDFIELGYYKVYSREVDLSSVRLNCFQDLLRYCFERGIDVVVALTPNAPLLERFLVEQTRYSEWIDSSISMFTSINHPGFSWFDLRDPADFNGFMDHFHDMIHMNNTNAECFITNILERFLSSKNTLAHSPGPVL